MFISTSDLEEVHFNLDSCELVIQVIFPHQPNIYTQENTVRIITINLSFVKEKDGRHNSKSHWADNYKHSYSRKVEYFLTRSCFLYLQVNTAHHGSWFCLLARCSFSIIISHSEEGPGKYALLGEFAAFSTCFLPIQLWGQQLQTLWMQAGGTSDEQFFPKNILDFLFILF